MLHVPADRVLRDLCGRRYFPRLAPEAVFRHRKCCHVDRLQVLPGPPADPEPPWEMTQDRARTPAAYVPSDETRYVRMTDESALKRTLSSGISKEGDAEGSTFSAGRFLPHNRFRMLVSNCPPCIRRDGAAATCAHVPQGTICGHVHSGSRAAAISLTSA
jgi:hypothetical protein